MNADPKIVTALLDLFSDERKAENQYLSHYSQCENAGLTKLAASIRERAADERRHADLLAARLSLFCAEPVAALTDEVGAETEAVSMFAAELTLENTARDKYNAAIKLAVEVADNDTRALLESILKDETDHTHEIEQAQDQIDLLGLQNYYTTQV